jgi:hypothetical protein
MRTTMRTAIVGVLAIGLVGLLAMKSQPGSSQGQNAGDSGARQRAMHRTHLMGLIDQGNAPEALPQIQALIDRPGNDFEKFESLRLMARCHKSMGNSAVAKQHLMSASQHLANRPQLAAAFPMLRHVVSLDLAEIAAFSEGDIPTALQHWETIRANPHEAGSDLYLLATRNSAMFLGQSGQTIEATNRAASLLAGEHGVSLPRREAALLKVSQASWKERAGDAAGAWALQLEIWNDYRDLNDIEVYWCGISAARGYPVPLACAQVDQLARQILAQLGTIRGADGTLPPAFVPVEQQLATIIKDSQACPGMQDLVEWALPRYLRTSPLP